MIRQFKLQHDVIYPDGEWRTIANESDEGQVDDNDIYFYLEDDINLSIYKEGDKIELDEIFKILQVKENE